MPLFSVAGGSVNWKDPESLLQTEAKIRKRGQTQAPNQSSYKALGLKPRRWGIWELRQKGTGWGTLKTTLLCQISMLVIFALSLCCPILQNGILKPFYFHQSLEFVTLFQTLQDFLNQRREQLLAVEELSLPARAPRSLKFGMLWLSGHLQRNPIITVCYDLNFMLRCWKENLFTEICFLYDFERSYILFLTLTVL